MKLNELAQEYKTRDSQMQLLASQLADPKSKVRLRIYRDGRLTAGLHVGQVHFAWILTKAERKTLAQGLRQTQHYRDYFDKDVEVTNEQVFTEHRVWALENA